MAFFNRWRAFREEADMEFYRHVAPLLNNKKVQMLDNYTQHRNYTRLRHCIDVAYYSFLITRFFNWDSRSAARAGLLHDMYYSADFHTGRWHHLISHPADAIENAKSICVLNEVEEDIILKHMWLCTVEPPRYKEGFVVTFVDKVCALLEAATDRLHSNVYGRVPIPAVSTVSEDD